MDTLLVNWLRKGATGDLVTRKKKWFCQHELEMYIEQQNRPKILRRRRNKRTEKLGMELEVGIGEAGGARSASGRS